MTHPTLLVPSHLDALVLVEPRLSVGPSAHFARLPHVWKGTDANADVPNLGNSIVAPPFQDQSFLLAPGVHLHWALPDGLTRARHSEHASPQEVGGEAGFPAVPNRWLVARRRQHAGRWVIEASWVVESDYLWPEDHSATDPVSVPSAWADSASTRPYRLMGRRTAHSAYPAGLDGGRHLARPLTAMGYGDPAFATVYQNCHSVFGLHDPVVPSTETRYDVFGWYSDSRHDPLGHALRAKEDDASRGAEVESRFGWKVLETGKIPPNTQTLCYVSMTVPAQRTPRQRSRQVEIAIGNTASEALSAFLASNIGGGTARDAVEDQLESILLKQRLAGKELDKAARLADARHEKGFVATFGGWVWAVKPQERPDHRVQDADHEREDPAASLDPELANRLTQLNKLQRVHDRSINDVEAARGQLFADWCKYMRVVHPPEATWQDHETFDGDELRVFIEQQAEALQGLVQTGFDKSAAALGNALSFAQERVAEINRSGARTGAKLLELQKLPGPRFYRPTEPVVLIHGKAVRVTERHGQDGREDADNLLRCKLTTRSLLSSERKPDLEALCAEIDLLRPVGQDGKPPAERIGFCAWEDPWHPILLEWEVELLPIARSGSGGSTEYSPDHITSRYALALNEVDLAAVDAVPRDKQHMRTYQGSSILTPHALRQHDLALRGYVVEHCHCTHEHLEDNRALVEAEHRAKLARHGQAEDDPVCAALCALGELDGKEFLSQSLTGVNDAFLGLHQSYQLPISDPLGFECERDLARRVRDLVLSFNRSAPADAGDFEPIRAGRFLVKRLRLVDTFGQIEDLDVRNARQHVSRSLRVGDGSEPVLPPRFVQPARVNLRWLSTTDETAESGAVPASTPICGWVIVDHLDLSLLIYDAHGRALGVISSGSGAGLWQAGWQAAPGNDAATQIWDIVDPHLRSVAEWFVARPRAKDWEDILGKIDTALDNIAPEAASQCEDLAVLMGRPLAVTRAHLSVSLAGPPAIHQGEQALFTDVRKGSRQSDKFEDVRVPVRLGAHERANDGLVAYWRQVGDRLEPEAHWPQSEAVAPILVAPSSRAAPQILTMLVDPLAEIHATSGVLPTKSITIPASMYVAELKRIELTLRSLGPILTRMGRLDLPLPVEPGYAWSWIERDDHGWSWVAGDLGASEDDGVFSGPILAREGWLRLTKVDAPESGASDARAPGTT
ncbi:MAG: hypothetical protein HY020_16220 [Burkholderiales bacterium]|nr:hypothetical protein [Burkholderiales bacterium]